MHGPDPCCKAYTIVYTCAYLDLPGLGSHMLMAVATPKQNTQTHPCRLCLSLSLSPSLSISLSFSLSLSCLTRLYVYTLYVGMYTRTLNSKRTLCPNRCVCVYTPRHVKKSEAPVQSPEVDRQVLVANSLQRACHRLEDQGNFGGLLREV